MLLLSSGLLLTAWIIGWIVIGSRVVLIAHEACYVLWCEESIAYLKRNDPRQR
jgi:hypothetical protein